MKIINQQRHTIYNYENISAIVIFENKIVCVMNNSNDKLLLGEYKTEERAKEVFNEIMHIETAPIYYLPKD